MRQALVSFADHGHYQDKMKRLEQSLKGNFNGDFLGFTSMDQITCPYPHKEVPFAFKPYAIMRAIDLGYDTILWCDSQVYAKSDIQKVFNYIDNNEYLLFDNIGYSIGDFTNDKTLDAFNIPRRDSWTMKMINAKVFGLSLKNAKNMIPEWFIQYYEWAKELYPGDWHNRLGTESSDMRVQGHRHDQSVLSCLAWKYRLKIIKSQDTFFANEEHRKVMNISPTVCLWAQ